MVDSLCPGSIFGFDASPVRRLAQSLCGRRSFAGINDVPSLDHCSFGAISDAAGLGILSPGNNLGPAFDSLQSTPGSDRKISPIGTPETPIARSDLRKSKKDEPVVRGFTLTAIMILAVLYEYMLRSYCRSSHVTCITPIHGTHEISLRIL